MAKRPKKKATKGKTKTKKKAAPKKKAATKKKTAPKKKAVSRKATPKKKVAKRKTSSKKSSERMVLVTVPQHITIDLPPALHDRLKGLSQLMDMSMEAVMRQAFTEFADTWEEHHRTVAALADDSDRMQLSVPDEDEPGPRF